MVVLTHFESGNKVFVSSSLHFWTFS